MDGVFPRTAMWPRLQPHIQRTGSVAADGAARATCCTGGPARRPRSRRPLRAVVRVIAALVILGAADQQSIAQSRTRPGGYDAMNDATPGPEPKRGPEPILRRTAPIDIGDSDNPLLQPLTELRIEGNATIPEYVILQKIGTRAGRPASQSQITEDVRALYETRWFTSVTPVYQQSEAGLALVFRVVEKPVVRSVKFHGNTWRSRTTFLPEGIKDNKLEAETGLRAGAPFDVTINKEAAQRIEELFVEKGYRHVKVELRKGGDPDDRDVVFVIKAGPKVQVRSVRVEGNTFARDAVLQLGKETKPRWWWPLAMVGGKYDPESVPNDEIAITQYYQGLGFFDVEVSSDVKWATRDKSLVDVVFQVKEGPRYKVRDVQIVGAQVVPERRHREGLKLVRGEYFNARHLSSDVTSMKSSYDELGRLFATVDAQPEFLNGKHPEVNLVYRIDEDRVYYIGDIHIGIRGDHPHTSEDVIRNQVDAFIKPGSLANAANIRKMQARLMGSHLWERSDPPRVNIRRVEGSDYLALDVVGRAQSISLDAAPQTHSQTDAPATPAGYAAHPAHTGHPAHQVASAADATAGRRTSGTVHTTRHGAALQDDSDEAELTTHKPIAFGHSVAAQSEDNLTDAWQRFLEHAPRRVRQRAPVVESPTRDDDSLVLWEISPPTAVIRAQSDDVFRAQSPDYRGQSMNSWGQPVPQDYLQGVSPQGDPFGNGMRGPIGPGFVDVDIDVTEARTGRLMFGVGVNSDAGVVGNIVLEENNFDIMRPPRSFADILNGQAWRGGGQSFRIEAVPGSEVSRYLMSWQDPFFLNTDFSFGVSGFYYTRFFEDWDEQRLGGRVSLGRLLGNFWSLSGAVRLENVHIDSIRAGAPAVLTDVAGDNFLSTGRIALAHDTRDSSFLPTQGHLVEGSYEQGFGDFNYPRFELTGSQFFTVYERPDGRGKHILQLRGQTGWTGDDTPIFERFFAGGFQSFRGFEFRGVTPREGTTKVGGQFMLLGTAEYIIPITADDNVRGVLFSDFGTVEPDVSVDQFRVSVGAGLRLIVPAMGPAPIALDFAYPLVQEDFDEKQVFSFYVGFTR
jgi:outer membrane protein insertion porin family